MKRDQRKAMAIKALSVTSSITEAAELAGISRRTLYTYLHDPGFIKELEKAYNSMIIQQVSDLQGQKRRAEEVLSELLEYPDPRIRLKAAKVVLDNIRMRELAMLGIFLRACEQEKNDPLGFFS